MGNCQSTKIRADAPSQASSSSNSSRPAADIDAQPLDEVSTSTTRAAAAFCGARIIFHEDDDGDLVCLRVDDDDDKYEMRPPVRRDLKYRPAAAAVVDHRLETDGQQQQQQSKDAVELPPLQPYTHRVGYDEQDSRYVVESYFFEIVERRLNGDASVPASLYFRGGNIDNDAARLLRDLTDRFSRLEEWQLIAELEDVGITVDRSDTTMKPNDIQLISGHQVRSLIAHLFISNYWWSHHDLLDG